MNKEEQQYLDLLKDVLENGIEKEDRTGVGTYSVFGRSMRFSMRDHFILLTTKKVFLRGIFEELKLFLSGDTDTTKLEKVNVNIWKGNTRRDFLDKKGLTSLPEGDLGCSYPHQWRKFGGEHPHIPETKGLKGFDQIQNIIRLLKEDPMSRRILLTGVNPQQEHLMSLPCCHCLANFNVNAKTNELNCLMYMRSNDILLGLPFNLAQYNLLTLFLCKITGYKPGDLFYVGCDVHLYSNHIEQAKVQIQREPRIFPKISFKKEISSLNDVLNLDYRDLDISGYDPHPPIKAEMAI